VVVFLIVVPTSSIGFFAETDGSGGLNFRTGGLLMGSLFFAIGVTSLPSVLTGPLFIGLGVTSLLMGPLVLPRLCTDSRLFVVSFSRRVASFIM